MNSRTVERLLDLLEKIAVRNHKIGVKILALERMLARRPEPQAEYDQEVRQMDADLGNQTNIHSIEEAIKDLHSKLLQD